MRENLGQRSRWDHQCLESLPPDQKENKIDPPGSPFKLIPVPCPIPPSFAKTHSDGIPRAPAACDFGFALTLPVPLRATALAGGTWGQFGGVQARLEALTEL